MLREAGIAAHVALLRAGVDFDVHPDLPGMGRFNHAIVRVDATAKDPAMWVDPTDDFAHAGELPSQDQGRLALIAAGDTSSLTKTPETPSTANKYSETRIYTLPEDGKAHVTEVSETVTGSEDSFQRHYYAESDRTKYREQIETYVKSYYSAKKLEKVEATDPHDLTKPFRVTIEASEADTGVARDGDAAVAFHPANLHELAAVSDCATTATITPRSRARSASASLSFRRPDCASGRIASCRLPATPCARCRRTRRRSSARPR